MLLCLLAYAMENKLLDMYAAMSFGIDALENKLLDMHAAMSFGICDGKYC